MYEKHNKVIKLLSGVWNTYVKNFNGSKNYDIVLQKIQELQKIIFEEENK